MPVFNAGQFLSSCLDSILRQSDGNWELIAVDDYSTDMSLSTLRSYASRDHRIQVLQNTNKGIVPALRKAFTNSRGGLVTRMDADDMMAPEKLAVLRKILSRFGQGHVATGLVKYFSEEGLGDGYKRYESWLNKLSSREENYLDIYRECVIPSPNWMVFRDDLRRIGGFDAEVYPEDYDLCFRFYKEGLRVKSSLKTLHYWRDHHGRTSRNDVKYSNQSYFDLKVPYFLELELNPLQNLVLWGAGRKGKRIAELLVGNGQQFKWICNNPRKVDQIISGTRLEHVSVLDKVEKNQVIIAVSNPTEQKKIESYCAGRGWVKGSHYFFFC